MKEETKIRLIANIAGNIVSRDQATRSTSVADSYQRILDLECEKAVKMAKLIVELSGN